MTSHEAEQPTSIEVTIGVLDESRKYQGYVVEINGGTNVMGKSK